MKDKSIKKLINRTYVCVCNKIYILRYRLIQFLMCLCRCFNDLYIKIASLFNSVHSHDIVYGNDLEIAFIAEDEVMDDITHDNDDLSHACVINIIEEQDAKEEQREENKTGDDQNISDARKKLINNLKELGKVQDNQKLWIEDGILSIDGSWFPSYSRWKYDQGKQSTVDFIEKIIVTACKLSDNEDDIRQYLIDAYGGIKNIKTTYNGNDEICNKIDKILELIESARQFL